MEKSIACRLIRPCTNVLIELDFIVLLAVIRILSLVYCHTPHLLTTTLLQALSFGLIDQEIQNVKSKVVTSSGTHRAILVQKE
jgi:hypothetical protein